VKGNLGNKYFDDEREDEKKKRLVLENTQLSAFALVTKLPRTKTSQVLVDLAGADERKRNLPL
jgi:hypothetical protein